MSVKAGDRRSTFGMSERANCGENVRAGLPDGTELKRTLNTPIGKSLHIIFLHNDVVNSKFLNSI